MEKIVVLDEKCNACGMCTMECDLLKETAEGKAEVILPGIISENMVVKVKNIVNMCPEKALKIVEVAQGKSKRKALLDLKFKIEEKLKLTMPSSDNYAFNRSDYELPVLSSPAEYKYKYSSYKNAESEGLSEFRDTIHSQKVPIAQQVVISYKHDKLLKFIKYEERSGNYKYETNKKLKNQLRAYVAEIEAYTNQKLCMDKGFFEFNTKDNDALKYILEYGVDSGWASRIASEVEPYDWFGPWINSDETTVCVEKKGWFSSSVEYEEKDMYCFKLADASKELNNQILNECQSEISELANGHVESELKEYHRLLEVEWKKKVEILIQKIENINVDVSKSVSTVNGACKNEMSDEEVVYDRRGYNRYGYDRSGFNKSGIHKNGSLYNDNGFNSYGRHKNGTSYDKEGYNKDGYNKKGYDRDGYDKDGYDKDGYDKDGYSKNGYDKNGYDKDGYNKNGYDKNGYDKNSFNGIGQHKNGKIYDDAGYNKKGFNVKGHHKNGTRYDDTGHDRWGRKKS